MDARGLTPRVPTATESEVAVGTEGQHRGSKSSSFHEEENKAKEKMKPGINH